MKTDGAKFALENWETTQDGIWNCDPANVAPTTGDFGQPPPWRRSARPSTTSRDPTVARPLCTSVAAA